MNNNLKLSFMTEPQFEEFKKTSIEMYAGLSPHYRNLPLVKAVKLITNDFNSRFAPQGLATPGQFFLAITLQEKQIGYFHFSEFPIGTKSIFGWNFHIYAAYQRKGLGKEAVEVAKTFLKEKGYEKVTLNVMADNEAAIKIYKSFKFQVTQHSMESAI